MEQDNPMQPTLGNINNSRIGQKAGNLAGNLAGNRMKLLQDGIKNGKRLFFFLSMK